MDQGLGSTGTSHNYGGQKVAIPYRVTANPPPPDRKNNHRGAA